MSVYYEWCLEVMDLSSGPVHGDETDIIDLHFFDKCPGLPTEPDHRLVLVRESDRDFKAWAYVMDGKIEAWCRCAYGKRIAKVPQKYLRQFERAIKATNLTGDQINENA